MRRHLLLLCVLVTACTGGQRPGQGFERVSLQLERAGNECVVDANERRFATQRLASPALTEFLHAHRRAHMTVLVGDAPYRCLGAVLLIVQRAGAVHVDVPSLHAND